MKSTLHAILDGPTTLDVEKMREKSLSPLPEMTAWYLSHPVHSLVAVPDQGHTETNELKEEVKCITDEHPYRAWV
jgi:hypothetical protein